METKRLPTRFFLHAPLIRRLALPLALAVAAVPALASDDCDVPIEQWQPREAVLQKAAQQGWEVQRLKIDDGCYEIRGRDENGRAFKAKLDPRTLETVKMKRRDGERARDRDRDRVHRPAAGASAAGGSRATIE